MTFSIVARDADGALGAFVCSSSPAVAARCLHLSDGAGAVASQNVTDPRLGTKILALLADGVPAADALARVVDDAEHVEYRQLLVVDESGRAAVHSGASALGVHADATGDGVAAGGNLLSRADIPQIMIDAFAASTGDLEHRLIAAARAAMDAGGEAGPVHSAGLSVIRGVGWRVTDLRVDWAEEDPIGQLDDLVQRWLAQRDDYVTRALDPTAAPSYGVPGDE